MLKDVCKLYANIMPFYVSDLSIHEFWYSWGVLEPIPCRYHGTTVLTLILVYSAFFQIMFSLHLYFLRVIGTTYVVQKIITK